MKPDLLDVLARDVAAMPVAGDAMPFALPPGVTREGDEPFVLRFDPPVDVRAFAAAFGEGDELRLGDWLVRPERSSTEVTRLVLEAVEI